MAKCNFTEFGFGNEKVLFVLTLVAFVIPPRVVSVPLCVRCTSVADFATSVFNNSNVPLVGAVAPVTMSTLINRNLGTNLFVCLCHRSCGDVPGRLRSTTCLSNYNPMETFASVVLVGSTPVVLMAFLLDFM